MSDSRAQIEAAKRALPLPGLLRMLGIELPSGDEGSIASPFVKGRRQKTPSFSIFRRGDAWGWVDRSGGDELKGDEITFLEKFEGLPKADAISRFLSLAGAADSSPRKSRRQKAPRSSGKAVPDPAGVDWPAAVAAFSPDHAALLAKWRGFSREFVAWLHAREMVGIVGGNVAFPVHDKAGNVIAAHVRRKGDSGAWFYVPRGSGQHPMIFGNPASAERTMVFESQWDAFAIMDAAGWHRAEPEGRAVLVTRGASNGRFASAAGGAVYAWPQNDEEKSGRRAGEEWLKAVAASVPGNVFAVRIPASHKDANDWTRAEKVDIEAALAAAVTIEKPLSVFEKATGGRPEGKETPPEPPFDPEAVLESLGLYWLNGSPCYFLRRETPAGPRFLEMGAAEVRRKLRVQGYRVRANPEAGESASQIDRVLDAATESRAVDFALSIGGTPAGVYDHPGGRILVRESPRLIEPREGSWGTISDFLLAILGDDAERFCCWLKVGYDALRAGVRRPGQALIIVGPPDCGKSRIQHQIITPILAGRSADPKSFFFGKTDFNAELVGAEHLLIEEVPSSSRHEERLFFGEKIKEVVANDTARLHKKNRDAVTVSPFWRLSITLNDNPEKLRCLPPLTEDMAEKIIMIHARPAPEFWKRFAEAPDPRAAFRDAISGEMPAFAHALTQQRIPEKLQGRRYGVASYIPEEIGAIIFEGEPEHHLMILIEKGFFPDGSDDAWTGDAQDLKDQLLSEDSPVRGSARRLLDPVQLSTLGIWLRHLATKFPGRVRNSRTATKRLWSILPPIKS